MKKGIVTALALMAIPIVFAQTRVPSKSISQIDLLIADEDYTKAIETISRLKTDYPDDPILELKLGVCYLNSPMGLPQAILNLEKAVALIPVKGASLKTGIEANFYYGQAFHRAERFLEAKSVFESLRRQIPPKQKSLLEKIDKELQTTTNAIELSIAPVPHRITNLGPQINTPYDEHSPLVDQLETILVFTSNHQSNSEKTSSGMLDSEDIYISSYKNSQWQRATPIGTNINNERHNASVSMTHDAHTLIIYQHDGLSGNLYVSKLEEQTWSVPTPLPMPINTSYNETHGCFTSDGLEFYFTSDRPGGYGKRDLYVVRKLPNGDWGKAQNLGSTINTSGNEESPFISSDGHTLYFASTEHKNIGGYDIFKSTKTDSTGWSSPVNIGYPINTPGDDLFYNPSADGTRVYYSSQRQGGVGGSDIYLIEFPDNDPRSLSVVSGYVFDAKKNPFAKINVTLYDVKTGETVGVYRPNATSGKYVMVVPSGRNYRAVYVTANSTFERTFFVSSRQSYESGNWAHYLEPIFVEE